MSKVLEASCEAGVVTADGVPVAVATILSKGIGSSDGILILDADQVAAYLADTAPDLETTIQAVIDALSQVKTALDKVADGLTQAGTVFTATFAAMTGPTTAPPPAGPAGVVQITTDVVAVAAASTAIASVKTQLQTLKAQLK